MMSPLSPAGDARGAGAPAAAETPAPAPSDLFAALLNLLGALPVPARDISHPTEKAAQPGVAPSGEDSSDAQPGTPQPGLELLVALPLLPNTPLPAVPSPVSELPLETAPAARRADSPARLPLLPSLPAGTSAPAELAGSQPQAPPLSPVGVPEPDAAATAAPAKPATPVPSAHSQGSSRANDEAAPQAQTQLTLARAFAAEAQSVVRPAQSALPPPTFDPARQDSARLELPVSQAHAPIAADSAAVELPARAARAAPSAQPVVSSALWLAEQGGGQARLALSPPELGPVEILVRVRGRRVEVHLRVEESAAQQVVSDSRAQLADALASRELRMDGFSVNGAGVGASGSDPRGAARDGGAQQPPGSPRPIDDPRPALAKAHAPQPATTGGGAIDLRV